MTWGKRLIEKIAVEKGAGTTNHDLAQDLKKQWPPDFLKFMSMKYDCKKYAKQTQWAPNGAYNLTGAKLITQKRRFHQRHSFQFENGWQLWFEDPATFGSGNQELSSSDC